MIIKWWSSPLWGTTEFHVSRLIDGHTFLLRKILLGDRRPALGFGIAATIALVGVDCVFDAPILVTNGVLVLLLGGFYRDKDLQTLAITTGGGLVLAAVMFWNPTDGLWWCRIAVLVLSAAVFNGMRHTWMVDYVDEVQGRPLGKEQTRPATESALNDSDSEPSTRTFQGVDLDDPASGLSTGFWDESDDQRALDSPSPPWSNTNRTPLLVRLIDTGVFSRTDCEVICSILYDAPDLEIGLQRCVLYGKLTGFQADCIAQNGERRLRVGRYTLLSELGQGGMGTVYRAFDRERQEEVALKLFQNLGQHLLFIRREMTILQELAHPNLITAYDVGDSDGYHYIAMEILIGETLQAIVGKDNVMTEPEAVEATLQVAQAMQHMHQRGVVHRDIKPSNVMRLACGRYKLMDLGICRPSGGMCEFDSFDLGDSNTYGTIGYAAPEQLDREGEVDFRSDYYSLGSLLFFLLTGKCYLRGNSLRERLHTLLVERDMRDLDAYGFSDEIVKFLSYSLQYESADRPQSDAEILEALSDIHKTSQVRLDDCRITVLVVEDDETDYAVTERILQRSNQSLNLIRSPTLAGVFEKIADHTPSSRHPIVVLLDLHLPDATVEETLAGIRQINDTHAGVVAISGDDSPKTRERCVDAGALDFVSKQHVDSHLLERKIFTTASRLLSNPGSNGQDRTN